MHKEFVAQYYKQLGDKIDNSQIKVKQFIENSEDDITDLYIAFNTFIENVDGHRGHEMFYFYETCYSVLADLIYYSELDVRDILSIDTHDLLLSLFTDWAENNDIDILGILTD